MSSVNDGHDSQFLQPLEEFSTTKPVENTNGPAVVVLIATCDRSSRPSAMVTDFSANYLQDRSVEYSPDRSGGTYACPQKNWLSRESLGQEAVIRVD
jgi:hypothetical protein